MLDLPTTQARDVSEQSSHSEGVRLLVAMPALNEDRTIEDMIRRVPRDLPGVSQVDVLVVDDGSTDSTSSKAAAAGAQVISHGQQLGVGAAFHTALRVAMNLGSDLLVTIDSDGQFDPATIADIVAPVIDGRADFVTASRFADPARIPQMPAVKKWGNRVMSKLISSIIHQKFFDVSCGMRCYNREAIVRLTLTGSFTYTQEVFLNLAFKRMRIMEVPITVRGVREFGKSRVASSILRYAINTATIILRTYRDYKPMRFFGRLALLFGIPGVLLSLFLLVHVLMTGSFTPHKWAGFTGGTFILLGLVFLHMGIIGDMLDRHRIYLEEVLYMVRQSSGQDRNGDRKR